MMAETSTQGLGDAKLELFSGESHHARERGIDDPVRNDAPYFTLGGCVDWIADNTLGWYAELAYGEDICDSRYQFEKWASDALEPITQTASTPTLPSVEADLEAQKGGFSSDLNSKSDSSSACLPDSGLIPTLQHRLPVTSDHLKPQKSEELRQNINFCRENTLSAIFGGVDSKLKSFTYLEPTRQSPQFGTPGYTTHRSHASPKNNSHDASNNLLVQSTQAGSKVCSTQELKQNLDRQACDGLEQVCAFNPQNNHDHMINACSEQPNQQLGQATTPLDEACALGRVPNDQTQQKAPFSRPANSLNRMDDFGNEFKLLIKAIKNGGQISNSIPELSRFQLILDQARPSQHAFNTLTDATRLNQRTDQLPFDSEPKSLRSENSGGSSCLFDQAPTSSIDPPRASCTSLTLVRDPMSSLYDSVFASSSDAMPGDFHLPIRITELQPQRDVFFLAQTPQFITKTNDLRAQTVVIYVILGLMCLSLALGSQSDKRPLKVGRKIKLLCMSVIVKGVTMTYYNNPASYSYSPVVDTYYIELILNVNTAGASSPSFAATLSGAPSWLTVYSCGTNTCRLQISSSSVEGTFPVTVTLTSTGHTFSPSTLSIVLRSMKQIDIYRSLTVTADSLYTAADAAYGNCLNGVVDGIFWPEGVGQLPGLKCCLHTSGNSVSSTWLNIQFWVPVVVQSVFIVNREGTGIYDVSCPGCADRIIGTDLYVGFNANPGLNVACGANPQRSGLYSCGGKIGKYVGLYKTCPSSTGCALNICQIRVYSYKMNAHVTSFPVNYTTNGEFDINVTGKVWWMNPYDNSIPLTSEIQYRWRFLPQAPEPGYVTFDMNSSRYIQSIMLVGAYWPGVTESSANPKRVYEETRNWRITVGASPDGTQNTQYAQWVDKYYEKANSFDYLKSGTDFAVGAFGRYVTVFFNHYSNYGSIGGIRYFGVTSTSTDCTGAFVWSGLETAYVPVLSSDTVTTFQVNATISDCAISYAMPTLPSYATYNVNTQVLSITVSSTQAPTSYTFSFTAYLYDGVSAYKTETKTKQIYIHLNVKQNPANYTFTPGTASSLELRANIDTGVNTYTLSATLTGAPSWLTVGTCGTNTCPLNIASTAVAGTFSLTAVITGGGVATPTLTINLQSVKKISSMTGATVTSDSLASGTAWCLSGVVDGNFWTEPSAGLGKCCVHTLNPTGSSTWFNVQFEHPIVVQSVFIVNREGTGIYDSKCQGCEDRIIGSDIRVGFNANPGLNVACGANPQKSGLYSCGGKIGTYVGLYMTANVFNICQIRVYSYLMNNVSPTVSSSDNTNNSNQPANWNTYSNSYIITSEVSDVYYFHSGATTPASVSYDLGSSRYVQSVLLIGAYYPGVTEGPGSATPSDKRFEMSKHWQVTVGNSQTPSLNTVYAKWTDKSIEKVGQYDFLKAGTDFAVGALGRYVSVLMDIDQNYQGMGTFRYFGVTSTATDCTGAFVWSGIGDAGLPILASSTTYTFQVNATISDCAISYSQPTLSDGSALPAYVKFYVNDRVLTVTVSPSQTPSLITVSFTAHLFDGVSVYKNETKTKNIYMFSSLSWVTNPSSFSYQTPTTTSTTFNLANNVACNPSSMPSSLLSLTLTRNGAPSWLSKSGSILIISTTATQGKYTFTIDAVDASGISLPNPLSIVLYIYNAAATSLAITTTAKIQGGIASTFDLATLVTPTPSTAFIDVQVTALTYKPTYMTQSGNTLSINPGSQLLIGNTPSFSLSVKDLVTGSVTAGPTIVYAQVVLMYVGSTPSLSSDLVGLYKLSCTMGNADSGSIAENACDFVSTSSVIQSTTTTVGDDFNKAFYIQLSSPQQIRSFYIDSIGTTSNFEVDISPSVPIVRLDTRYNCRSNIGGRGLWNCQGSAFKGTYFILWPLAGQTGLVNIREVRLWSTQDFAQNTGWSVTSPGGTVTCTSAGTSITPVMSEIVGSQAAIDQVFTFSVTTWFILNIGAAKNIAHIWLLFGGGNVNQTFEISMGTTVPTARFSNYIQFNTKGDSDYEEWNYKPAAAINAQYIVVDKPTSAGVIGSDNMYFRKIAVFQANACTPITSVTQTVTYAAQDYTKGATLSFAWPAFTIVPASCFALSNLLFTDASNADMVTDGRIAINWVSKTISYMNSVDSYDPTITMKGVFSSPTDYTETTGTTITLTGSCFATGIITGLASTSASPTVATSTYQIKYTQPNLQTVYSFPLNTDSAGTAKNNITYCGQKTYTTNKTWATIKIPADPTTTNYELQVDTNDLTLVGDQIVEISIGFATAGYVATAKHNVKITINHPCKATLLTTSQTIADIHFPFGGWNQTTGSFTAAATTYTFSAFADSISTEYSITGFCGVTYSLSAVTSTDLTTFGITITNSTRVISVKTQNPSLMGASSSLITLSAYSAIASPLTNSSSAVTFKVYIDNTCANTVITFNPTLANIQYTAGAVAYASAAFTAATDSLSTTNNNGAACGTFTYSIAEATATAFTYVTVDQTLLKIGVYTTDVSKAQSSTLLNLKASLTNYTTVANITKSFYLTILDPCATTTLTATTIVDFTIYAFYNNGGSQQFNQFTDSLSQSAGAPGMCGPRTYTVATVPVSNIIFSVTAPAAGSEFTSPWTLSYKSNNLADVLAIASSPAPTPYTVKLTGSLTNYPGVASKTAQVTNSKVLHPCVVATISPATITYTAATLVKSQQVQVAGFKFNPDDIGTVSTNNGTIAAAVTYCGTKTYTIGATWSSWVSIVAPADPATGDFLLKVSDDYTKTPSPAENNYTVTATVGYADTSKYGLTQTYTQTFTFSIYHPCKGTLLTTSQTINDIHFPFGGWNLTTGTFTMAATTYTFNAFADSVSVAYQTAGFCQVTYSLTSATSGDLTKFGISINSSTRVISVNINTPSLMNATSSLITLSATSAVVSSLTTASSAVTFSVIIDDTCANTVITFSPTLAAISYTVGDPEYVFPAATATPPAFAAATDSLSTISGNANACGPYAYSIAEQTATALTYITVDQTNRVIKVLSKDVTHARAAANVNLKAALANYSTVATKQVAFSLQVIDPCPSTVISAPTLTSFTIYSFYQNGSSQLFAQFTDSKATAAAKADMCGPRTYTVTSNATYVVLSVIAPTAGTEFTSPYNLTYKSDDIRDALKMANSPVPSPYMLTLTCRLTNYPVATYSLASYPNLQMSITTTFYVKHPCMLATISNQTVTMTPKALVFQEQVTVANFKINPDDITTLSTNYGTLASPGVPDCGAKTYTVEATKANWLSVIVPTNFLTDDHLLNVTTHDYNKTPSSSGGDNYTVSITVGYLDTGKYSLTQTFTQTITFRIYHPCKLTKLTTTQTFPNMWFMFGGYNNVSFTMQVLNQTFSNFTDSVSNQYASLASANPPDPLYKQKLCNPKYYLTSSPPVTNPTTPPDDLTAAGYNTTVYSIDSTVSVFVNIKSLKGTVTNDIVLSATSLTFPQDTPSDTLTFKVSINDTCANSTIDFGSYAIKNLSMTVTKAADSQSFPYPYHALANATGIPDICEGFTYAIVNQTQRAFTTIDATAKTITLKTNNMIYRSPNEAVVFQTNLTSYPNVYKDLNFNVTLIDPCLTTVIETNPIVDFNITYNHSLGTSQTFLPFQDTQADAAFNDVAPNGRPELCGPKTYVIKEAIPASFITITPPANNANNYTNAWTMTVLTNNRNNVGPGDDGIWTITLEASLDFYPSITPKTTQITNSVVLDPCVWAKLNIASITTPLSYQIIHSETGPFTISTFVMNTDNTTDAYGDPMYCGTKTYVTDKTWIAVTTPPSLTDPNTQKFTIDVSTNDYLKTGDYVVTITIGYEDVRFKDTTTQQIDVTLIHPCKTTNITTTQQMTANDTIVFFFGGASKPPFTNQPLITTFLPFDDSVSTDYAVTDLCGLAYTLSPAAEATKYNTSVVTGATKIRVFTANPALKGTTSANIIMTADSTTKQQDLPSQNVTFQVQVVDTCPQTVISFGLFTLADMHMTITQTMQNQTFVKPSDALSDATSNPDVCGGYNYVIKETALTFITINQTDLIIHVLTNDMTLIKNYTVTFQAFLKLYPDVPPAELIFTVELIDPCLTTSLTLPTTLQGFTITGWDLVGFNQTFAAATDAAALIAVDGTGVPNLCGPRIYTIQQTQPQNFMTISPPSDGLNYTSSWSLYAYSQSFADVGVWSVTLKVTLQNYPAIPSASKSLSAVVRDPCLDTTIVDFTINDMLVLIYDSFAQVQFFGPVNDTFSMRADINTPGMCGNKAYISDLFLAKIGKPQSGLVNVDQWNITSFTQDKKDIAQYTVSIQVSMAKYPTVPKLIKQFKLQVGDPCEMATVLPFARSTSNVTTAQNMTSINYFPYLNITTNGTSQFMPFTTDVDLRYNFTNTCGPLVYSIAEEVPKNFATVFSPEKYANGTTNTTSMKGWQSPMLNTTWFPGLNETANWTLSVNTTNLTYVTSWNVTVIAKLEWYNNSTPANTTVNVTIIHPCTVTTLTPPVLSPMKFVFGKNTPSVSKFQYWKDTIGVQLKQNNLCGNRQCNVTEASYLALYMPSPDADQFQSDVELNLLTTQVSDIGTYTHGVTCWLANANYSMVPAAISEFQVDIFVNRPPTFNPKLQSSDTIVQTCESQSWSLTLPKIDDPEKDPVIVKADLGSASFAKQNGKTSIEIADIMYPSITKDPQAMFLWRITLNDGFNTVDYSYMLFVLSPSPPCPEKEVDDKAKDESKENDEGGGFDGKQKDKKKEESNDFGNQFSELIIKNEKNKAQTAAALDMATRAKTECVPATANAKYDGSLSLNFYNYFEVKNLTKFKESVSMNLVKADPSVPPTGFNFTVTATNSKTLVFSLTFENPESISSNSEVFGKDYMNVTVHDAASIINCPKLSPLPGRMLAQGMPNFNMMSPLPIQFAAGAAAAAESIAAAANSPTTKGAMIGTMAINYAAGCAANLLFSGINSLQVIVTNTQYNIIVPPNSVSILSFVKTMVSFDMVYSFWDPTQAAGFTVTPPYNESFEQLGWGSLEFFDALGSVGAIIFLTVLYQIGIAIIQQVADRTKWGEYKLCTPIRQRKGTWAQNKVDLSNGWIRMFLENYLNFLVAFIIAMYFPISIREQGKVMQGKDQFSIFWAYFFMIATVLFTIFVSYMVFYQFRQPVAEEALEIEINWCERFIDFYHQVFEKKGIDPNSIAAEQNGERKNAVQQISFNPNDSVSMPLKAPLREEKIDAELVSGLNQLKRYEEEEVKFRNGIDGAPRMLSAYEVADLERRRNEWERQKIAKHQAATQASIKQILQSNEPKPKTQETKKELHELTEAEKQKLSEENEFGEKDLDEKETHHARDMPKVLTGQAEFLMKKMEKLDPVTIKHNYTDLQFRLASLKVKQKKLIENPIAEPYIGFEYFQELREGYREGSLTVLMVHANFMFRRSLMMFCAFWFNGYPLFQLFLSEFTTLFTIIYMAYVRPNDNEMQNTLDLFNECLILFVVDVLITLLGTITTTTMMVNFGTMFNVLIAAMFLGNFGLLFVLMGASIRDFFKRHWILWKERLRKAQQRKKQAELEEAKREAKKMQQEINQRHKQASVAAKNENQDQPLQVPEEAQDQPLKVSDEAQEPPADDKGLKTINLKEEFDTEEREFIMYHLRQVREAGEKLVSSGPIPGYWDRSDDSSNDSYDSEDEEYVAGLPEPLDEEGEKQLRALAQAIDDMPYQKTQTEFRQTAQVIEEDLGEDEESDVDQEMQKRPRPFRLEETPVYNQEIQDGAQFEESEQIRSIEPGVKDDQIEDQSEETKTGHQQQEEQVSKTERQQQDGVEEPLQAIAAEEDDQQDEFKKFVNSLKSKALVTKPAPSTLAQVAASNQVILYQAGPDLEQHK